MNNFGQVVMGADQKSEGDILSTIGGQFRTLIQNLVQGNMKKAHSLAEASRGEIPADGEKIAFQNLIEEMAEDQALRNALINLPSVVPGVGTVISLWLISVEDFFLLDQGVKLILALSLLCRMDVDDRKALEDFVISVIAETYGLNPDDRQGDADALIRKFMIALFPQRYVNMGVNRGVRKFLRRLLPFRRKSRLLPAGLGIVMSAVDAYDTIVKTGQITLRHLNGKRNQSR